MKTTRILLIAVLFLIPIAYASAQVPEPVETYILSFAPEAQTVDANMLLSTSTSTSTRSYPSLGMIAADLTASQVESLRYNPHLSIYPNRQVRIQDELPWGLDRIDQRSLPLDGNYFGRASSLGHGVNIYVIDTGVRLSHQEFSGRAQEPFSLFPYNCLTDPVSTLPTLPTPPPASDSVPTPAPDPQVASLDPSGHGTHVAGIIAGTSTGVAPGVNLHSIRVLDCSGGGDLEGVIAGIDWVIQNHQPPAIANLSLGYWEPELPVPGTVPFDSYTPLDAAVRRMAQAGITVVVAAGNYGADACQFSPARAFEAITVGASEWDDFKTGFSNYGSCVDLYAPGIEILSAWHTGDRDTALLSGTSMSAPHVTGIAAAYLSTHPSASPVEVERYILDTASLAPNLDWWTWPQGRIAYLDPNINWSIANYNLFIPVVLRFEWWN